MVPDYTASSVCLKRQGSFIWLQKTLCLASVNIMTVCLFDTLAAFLSYRRAVVDPVICPIPCV